MKKIISLILVTVFVFSLCACDGDSAKLKLNEIESPVQINTNQQKAYLEDSFENVANYTNASHDDTPAPVKFSWEWTGEEKPKEFVLKACETKDFENAITERTIRNHAELYNFKLNTKYYWCVTAILDDKEIQSEVKEFTTVETGVRFINCDGVRNMRDIGGYKTEDGKTVKQGLVFRCGQLNTRNTTEKTITEDGLYVMGKLGIKTEIDIRTSAEAAITKSYISGANYYDIPITGSNSNKPASLFEKNTDSLVQIMKVLGDESNYPVIVHCAGGADRTGFLGYTLEALLGMKKEDCIRDYLLTNFSFNALTDPRVYSAIENDYVSGYDNCLGDTLAQKAENHLLEIGVAQSDIDNFRRIMLQ